MSEQNNKDTRIEDVKNYYGNVLQTNKDLQTNACCLAEAFPAYLKPALAKVHPDIQEKFYGCGSPIPYELKGKTVLDLGCGVGRDSYLFSQLVGPEGRVIGVDMTPQQLEVARSYRDEQMQTFGFSEPNVEFHQGFIEDLKSIGIADNSVDVVVSNCVINLSPDKKRVFSEVFRVLKPGGELFFSDVFADRRIPQELANDQEIVGECLGGALYIEDFRRLLAGVGCLDYRVLEKSRITIDQKEIEKRLGDITFHSLTVRTFKMDFEDRCEDFGQTAQYLGTIENSEEEFLLDDHHLFKKNEEVAVCGNTADMLSRSRYAKHFFLKGDRSTHKGIFDCAPGAETETVKTSCC